MDWVVQKGACKNTVISELQARGITRSALIGKALPKIRNYQRSLKWYQRMTTDEELYYNPGVVKFVIDDHDKKDKRAINYSKRQQEKLKSMRKRRNTKRD